MANIQLQYIEEKSSNNGQIKNSFLYSVLILLGFSLNQSSVIWGVNLSLSDFFSLLVFLILLIRNDYVFSIRIIFFGILLSCTTLFASVLIVPLVFGISPDFSSIISKYIILVSNIFYLLLGYNLSKHNYSNLIFKTFSLSSVLIALLGILVSMLNIPVLYENLFFENRYSGFMNDPNYFSILQIVAFVYIYFSQTTNKKKYILNSILIFSIIISGSKTGTITLLLTGMLLIIRGMYLRNNSIIQLINNFILVILMLFTVLFYDEIIESVIPWIANLIPPFQRLIPIFTDLETAISGGGSGRDETWDTAIELIKKSPIFGVGVGTYSTITNSLFNYNAIAHNTYLQLAAEWGLPISIFFFGFCIIVLVDFGKKLLPHLKWMLLVLLIGSIAISLNNARIFWIILGIIIYQRNKTYL